MNGCMKSEPKTDTKQVEAALKFLTEIAGQLQENIAQLEDKMSPVLLDIKEESVGDVGNNEQCALAEQINEVAIFLRKQRYRVMSMIDRCQL